MSRTACASYMLLADQQRTCCHHCGREHWLTLVEDAPLLILFLLVQSLLKLLIGPASAFCMEVAAVPRCYSGLLASLQVFPGLSCCPAIVLDACMLLILLDRDKGADYTLSMD